MIIPGTCPGCKLDSKAADERLAEKGFKAVIKGKAYGKDIDEALKEFEEALSHFKEEAHICSEQRLGRLEEHILSVKRTLARLEGNQEEARRTSAEVRKQQATLGVLNKAYKLLTSSEVFDSRTGGGKPTIFKLEEA